MLPQLLVQQVSLVIHSSILQEHTEDLSLLIIIIKLIILILIVFLKMMMIPSFIHNFNT